MKPTDPNKGRRAGLHRSDEGLTLEILDSQGPLILASRLALRLPEAAEALGISERAFRDILPEVPHTRIGRSVIIPVGPFEDWLRKRTEAEQESGKDIAQEIFDQLNDGKS